MTLGGGGRRPPPKKKEKKEKFEASRDVTSVARSNKLMTDDD